ncbi:hypothetical protein KY359_00005, partial [Candidatus Woesearchaeota archaeon]|nr:hypothetical protein [Candidatus Woesearchaeota archaeon]
IFSLTVFLSGCGEKAGEFTRAVKYSGVKYPACTVSAPLTMTDYEKNLDALKSSSDRLAGDIYYSGQSVDRLMSDMGKWDKTVRTKVGPALTKLDADVDSLKSGHDQFRLGVATAKNNAYKLHNDGDAWCWNFGNSNAASIISSDIDALHSVSFDFETVNTASERVRLDAAELEKTVNSLKWNSTISAMWAGLFSGLDKVTSDAGQIRLGADKVISAETTLVHDALLVPWCGHCSS